MVEVIRRKTLIVGNEPEGSENARVVNDVAYADIVDFLESHESGTGVTSHFPGKEDGCTERKRHYGAYQDCLPW